MGVVESTQLRRRRALLRRAGFAVAFLLVVGLVV
jgi:hypothetical protein